MIREGHEGDHLGAQNVIYFSLGGGYMDVCIHVCIYIQYIHTTHKLITSFSMLFGLHYTTTKGKKECILGKKCKKLNIDEKYAHKTLANENNHSAEHNARYDLDLVK